ncbi:3-oxoacyl-ACP reductase [Candidatus Atribacteria bacterium HGW-Atribacteria-1]|nr:MAG: 3-oxoacyl-ACP reductase [Candidatus Atribacteria bacterium HGW-Atribacteria-1]
MYKEKVCVVTGGGRGIGRAITETLLRNNYRVAVIDLDTGNIETEYKELVARGKLRCFKGNIENRYEIEKTFNLINKQMGSFDVLVNNAGILSTDNFLTETLEGWQRVINVNLTGTFICCKKAVDIMKKNRSGCIVNIVSISGLKPSVFSSPSYCASKAGVIGMSRSLAAQVAKYNIRVNSVAPSTTSSSMIDGLSEKVKESYKKSVPLGRLALPQDVANAVEFLVSEKASYITGEIVNVNGGLLMP